MTRAWACSATRSRPGGTGPRPVSTPPIRQTYPASTWGGTHQVSTIHGWVSFFQSPSHGPGADGIGQAQHHHLVGQQLQGPVAATLGRVAASQLDPFLLDVALDLDL